MALKLKLKVKPSESPEGERPSSSEGHSGPKIRVKPPTVKEEHSDKVSKHKPKKDKLKKLKLSLGKPSQDSQPSTSADAAAKPAADGPPKKMPRVRIKPTRVPGEGYDSEAPDVEDDPLIEQGVVIRFLDDANLDFVHNAVETGDLSNVNIKWITRDKAVINVNGTLYSARLVDLPTLTEIYKTVDKKNIFKTIDVSQVLLVLHQINPKQLNMDQDFEVEEKQTYTHPIYELSTNNEIRSSKTVYRHGLSYAFEDVFRRFKPAKTNHRVMTDVELRVDELIRRDAEAQESHYEYVDPKAQSRFGGTGPSGHSPAPNHTPSPSIPATPKVLGPNEDDEGEQQFGEEEQMDVDIEADLDNVLEQELAEALDSTSNNAAATVLMKSEYDQGDDNGQSDDGDLGFGQNEQDDDDDEEDEEDEEEEDEDQEEDEATKQDKNKVKKLEEEIKDLEKAADKQKVLLATASYKMMRMKFQSAYNNLKSQLDLKKRELAKFRELHQKQNPTEPSEQNAPQQREEEEDEDDDDDDDDNEQDDNGRSEARDVDMENMNQLAEATAGLQQEQHSQQHSQQPQSDEDLQEDYDDLQDLF